MLYIQRKDSNGLETVDEFTTRKEARAMLVEYRMSSWSAIFTYQAADVRLGKSKGVNHAKH